MLREALRKAAAGEPLTEGEAERALETVMEGTVPPAATAALLTALRVRGETVSEIVGFARAMRRRDDSQARQQGGYEPGWERGRTRGTRGGDRARARRSLPLHTGGRHRLYVRPHPPPRYEVRSPCAGGSAVPYGLQPARTPHEPGRSEAPARRGLRRRLRAPRRRGAPGPRGGEGSRSTRDGRDGRDHGHGQDPRRRGRGGGYRGV